MSRWSGAPRATPCQAACAAAPLRCAPAGDRASRAAQELAKAVSKLPALADPTLHRRGHWRDAPFLGRRGRLGDVPVPEGLAVAEDGVGDHHQLAHHGDQRGLLLHAARLAGVVRLAQ